MILGGRIFSIEGELCSGLFIFLGISYVVVFIFALVYDELVIY